MKLTKNNYYSQEANQKYASYSQIKSFAQCEAKTMAILNNEYGTDSSTALLVGSYIDSYLDGVASLGKFKAEHPEIFTRTGELKADYKLAENIILRIESDKVFRKLLRGRRQVIMTGTIVGVPIKIKIDSLHKNMIVDGKVMRDLEDIWDDNECARVSWWRFYRYDWQAYIYQTIVFQNTGIKLPFVNAVVTKEKGFDIRAFQYSQETIDNAGREVRAILPRLKAVKDGLECANKCDHCDYCFATRKLKKDEFEIL